MIRTKEKLIEALSEGHRLHGRIANRPSDPWRYEINGITVHGNAFNAASRAGLITCVVRHWNHCTYRAKIADKSSASDGVN